MNDRVNPDSLSRLFAPSPKDTILRSKGSLRAVHLVENTPHKNYGFSATKARRDSAEKLFSPNGYEENGLASNDPIDSLPTVSTHLQAMSLLVTK